MKAHVLTISDRVSAGVRGDASGPIAVEGLTSFGFTVTASAVPDDAEAIIGALRSVVAAGVDLVLTTGGTGLGPRDVTPEATLVVIDRLAPGLAELVRSKGRVQTAALSRAVAGAAGATLIVNLAGSAGAVRDGLEALGPVLPHAIEQLRGADH